MTDFAKRTKRVLVSAAVASAILTTTGSVRAQVVNGDFETPNVSGAPQGFLEGAAISGADVGWSFPVVAGGHSGITYELDANGFNAPAPPAGSQVGLIQNIGQISQSVDLQPGYYVLTFDLAERAFGWSGAGKNTPTPLPIQVKIGGHSFGPYSPTSTSAYNKVSTPPFHIATAGAQLLEFVGTGPLYVANVEDNTTFIDAVSISLSGPVITSGPADIDPTSSISLGGDQFGSPPGQIKVVFPSHSETPFSNGSKSELHLDTTGSNTSAKSTARIDGGHPQGAVNEQTVDITLASADGNLTSNVWHAMFHDNAVITSGPNTITPGQPFLLKGWDFDSTAECAKTSKNAGKITVHFPTKSWQQFNNQGDNKSYDDLVMTVPTGDDCTPDMIKIALPHDLSGVVSQDVQITFESPGGRKSNAWSAHFNPRLEMRVIPWQLVAVVSCSNQSAYDNCNNPNQTGSCWDFIPFFVEGTVSPGPDDSMIGYHVGCWGLSSDNGTDTYFTLVRNDWVITQFALRNLVDNASDSSTTNPPSPMSSTLINVSVNWHIGATGGAIWYAGDIYAKGPVGVPFQ